MRHCLFLFLCMAVRQCYRRRRDLELELYIWITSGDCWVLRGWIESQMHEEMRKGLDERIDESFLWWFGHVERMKRARITKRIYIRKYAGSRSVGKPWKRWIDTLKECLKKRGLDVRQTRKMVQDKSEWWGFVRGNAWGIAQGMNPRPWWDTTVVGCHSYMKPL